MITQRDLYEAKGYYFRHIEWATKRAITLFFKMDNPITKEEQEKMAGILFPGEQRGMREARLKFVSGNFSQIIQREYDRTLVPRVWVLNEQRNGRFEGGYATYDNADRAEVHFLSCDTAVPLKYIMDYYKWV